MVFKRYQLNRMVPEKEKKKREILNEPEIRSITVALSLEKLTFHKQNLIRIHNLSVCM